LNSINSQTNNNNNNNNNTSNGVSSQIKSYNPNNYDQQQQHSMNNNNSSKINNEPNKMNQQPVKTLPTYSQLYEQRAGSSSMFNTNQTPVPFHSSSSTNLIRPTPLMSTINDKNSA